MGSVNCCAIFTWILFISSVQGFHSRNDATKNEFPYHAHIEAYGHYNWIDSGRVIKVETCSGAVITSQFIITTYSCVWGAHMYRIRLGYLKPAKPEDNPAYDHLTEIRPYPSFNTHVWNLISPVALIRVEILIRFSDHIQPIKLPEPKNGFSDPSANYEAIATDYNTGEPDHLQWLNMQVVPMSECQPQFPNFTPALLCVDAGQLIDLCEVRGGVPLVLKSDNNTLIGLFERTSSTCQIGGVSIFLDVARHINWINKIIKENANAQARQTYFAE